VVKSRHESCSLDESKNRLSATNLSGWWRGDMWAVTAFGIEALNGKYVIEKDRLRD
jgi:hypothetical protein